MSETLSRKSPESIDDTIRKIMENAEELGIPDTPKYDDPNKNDARYQFPATSGVTEISNDDEKSAWEKLNEIQGLNDANALDAKKMDIWNDEELSSAEKIQQINDLGEEAIEAAGIAPLSLEKGTAETTSSAPASSAEAKTSNPDRRAAAEAAIDRFNDFTPEGYKRRGAATADRILKIYENEGTKGLIFAALRKIGRGAYKVSGLEREVRGMKRAFNAGERTVARAENAGSDLIGWFKKRRDKARERRANNRAAWNEFKNQVRDAHEKNKKRKAAEKREKKPSRAERKALNDKEKRDRERAIYEYNWRGGPRPDFLDEEKTPRGKAIKKKMGGIGLPSPYYRKSSPESIHGINVNL